ncbi:hypothetical protein, partial [Methylomonas lenta]|uniref:hypothetical protein n=1 Tax=Methylomonas lenta TaxID=980561 RepID=UPI001E5A0133
MNQRIGHQFAYGQTWVHWHVPPQRFANKFVIRQQCIEVVDQTFESSRVAFSAFLLALLGAVPTFALNAIKL